MRTIDEIIKRVDELHVQHEGEEYVVGITVEELKSLTDSVVFFRNAMEHNAKLYKRQQQLADAIYADAMLQQDKFKAIERV